MEKKIDEKIQNNTRNIKLILLGVIAHNHSVQFSVEYQENTGPGREQPDSPILLIIVIGPLN